MSIVELLEKVQKEASFAIYALIIHALSLHWLILLSLAEWPSVVIILSESR